MVGRTPEYLGKKIESYDVKMSMLYALIFPLIILTLHRRLRALAQRRALAITNPGPHGFTEILYAFTSGAGNNGSAFAGLSANMVVQRRAGLGHAHRPLPDDDSRARPGRQPGAEEKRAAFARHLPGNTPLFTVLLVGVVLILGALTFFPALSLGPILEHLLLKAGNFSNAGVTTACRCSVSKAG